ncbi:hypothetical protein [Piscirickettsia litoralis]|uniref:HTH cro/C1-type domain-containing protein n=1 Tax=Piscirickettsia litoralis TaxID=1891921 RepID=A0ABX3A1C8_9GAMM|nr:hypothetical protein [Piscirickettsia litoralis]ODN41210.1 hypothetical protein BGC07_17505 [Piscirickettsia litoralis]
MTKRQLKRIADNIVFLMNNCSPPMSKQNLADKSKVSYPTLTPILQGKRDFGVTKLIQISEALNTTPAEILNKTYAPPKLEKTLNDAKYLATFISTSSVTFCSLLKKGNKRCSKSTSEFTISCSHDPFEIIDNLKSAITSIDENIDMQDVAVFISIQEYEFRKQREELKKIANNEFCYAIIEADWKSDYLAHFKGRNGICVTINDGLSISHSTNQGETIKKTQGLGFPIADEGGNLWLGWQAIRHSIEAKEGVVKPTKLSNKILAMFNSDLSEMSEEISKSPNRIYIEASSTLKEMLYRQEPIAKSIVKNGFDKIFRKISEIDKITKQKMPICLSGDVSYLYEDLLPQERIYEPTKAREELLKTHGMSMLNDFVSN